MGRGAGAVLSERTGLRRPVHASSVPMPGGLLWSMEDFFVRISLPSAIPITMNSPIFRERFILYDRISPGQSGHGVSRFDNGVVLHCGIGISIHLRHPAPDTRDLGPETGGHQHTCGSRASPVPFPVPILEAYPLTPTVCTR